MTLNASGPISLGGLTLGQSISLEVLESGTSAISLGDSAVDELGGYSSLSNISMASFYGQTFPFQGTQQAKLVGSGNIGESRQGGDPYFGGTTTKISADGNTLVVGGPDDNNYFGATWVFTKSGTTWTQQAKLVPSISVSVARYWGLCNAISGDGNTLVQSSYCYSAGTNGVLIWTRSGTTWTQGPQLLVNDYPNSSPSLDVPIAISSDGSTIAIAAQGYTWIFVGSGTSWTQQAQIAGGGPMSLSGNGNILVCGDSNLNNNQGGCLMWTRSGTTWTSLGAVLPAPTGYIGIDPLEAGIQCEISDDGNTIALGCSGNQNSSLSTLFGQGGLWIYARSGSSWVQQAALIPPLFAQQAGSRIGLAGNGNTAIMTGICGNYTSMTLPNSIFIYTRKNGTWSFTGTPTITGQIGAASAEWFICCDVSGDGTEVVFSCLTDNSSIGATWVFR